MSCLSISQGATECSRYPVLRISKLVLLIGTCLSVREDDGEQQLEVPKGFTFHAEGMLDKNGLEIDRLLLQRKHAAEDDRSHQQLLMPNITQQLGGTATHLHITGPSALQQIGEELVGDPNKEPLFCDATESQQWKCMDGETQVDKVQEGKDCNVVCIDNYNFKAKKSKVKCKKSGDRANFNPVPDCLELEHCKNSGDGGWKCEDSYLTGNAKAPVEGTVCTPQCGEGFKAIPFKAHCKKGGQYDIEPKCTALGECQAAGKDWVCEDSKNGEEQVKHGKSCKVKCNDEKMVPVFDLVECNGEEIVDKRGVYKQGTPKCLSEKDAKEEKAKVEADMAAKQSAKPSKPAPAGGGTTPSALPRCTALIVVLVGMSNWLCLGSSPL